MNEPPDLPAGGSAGMASRRAMAGLLRPVLGWLVAAVGVLLIVLGWVGVSGTALTAKQVPYLVSGGLGGLALVIIGVGYAGSSDVRRELSRLAVLERQLGALLDAVSEPIQNSADASLTEPVSGRADDPTSDPAGGRASGPASAAVGFASAPTSPTGHPVAVAGGSSFHRPSCPLLAGKSVHSVDAAAVTDGGLRPCPVCDPPTTDVGDEPAAVKRAVERRPGAEDVPHPAADRPAADRPAADRPAADRPAADRPAADRPASSGG